MKILYCDNQEFFRNSVKPYLEVVLKADPVDLVEDGETAIEMLKKHQYDLVILEIRLPGINGLEILEIIKKAWPDIPVLILTIKMPEEYALEAFKLGASGYIDKCNAAEELKVAIKTIAHGKKFISKEVAKVLAKGGITDV